MQSAYTDRDRTVHTEVAIAHACMTGCLKPEIVSGVTWHHLGYQPAKRGVYMAALGWRQSTGDWVAIEADRARTTVTVRQSPRQARLDGISAAGSSLINYANGVNE